MPVLPTDSSRGALKGLKRFGAVTAEGIANLVSLGLWSPDEDELKRELRKRAGGAEIASLMKESVEEETVDYLAEDPTVARMLPVLATELGAHSVDIGAAGVGLLRLGKAGLAKLPGMAGRGADPSLVRMAGRTPDPSKMSPEVMATWLRKADVPESQVKALTSRGRRKPEVRLAQMPEVSGGSGPPIFGRVSKEAVKQNKRYAELRGLRAAQELPEMQGGKFAQKRADKLEKEILRSEGHPAGLNPDERSSQMNKLIEEDDRLGTYESFLSAQKDSLLKKIGERKNFPKEADALQKDYYAAVDVLDDIQDRRVDILFEKMDLEGLD